MSFPVLFVYLILNVTLSPTEIGFVLLSANFPSTYACFITFVSG